MADNIIARAILIGKGERLYTFKFKCLTCGKEYDSVRRDNKGYCSRECRSQVKRNCKTCGKEFISTRSMYCSHKCQPSQDPDKRKIIKQCLCCGKEYAASGKNNKGYCSKECRHTIKRTCAVCGGEFYSNSDNNNVLYCSNDCKIKGNPNKNKTTKHNCQTCGREFYGKPVQSFCSLKCRPSHRTIICQDCGNEFKGRLPEQYCETCKELRSGAYGNVSFKTCVDCGHGYVIKGIHQSNTGICKQCQDSKKKVNNEYRCMVCGKTIELPEGLGAPRKTCSDKCLKELNRSRGQKARRTRRYHFSENEKENVISIKVFERDNWVCHICGKKTLKTKIGSCDHPKSPTIDHIIPVSKGGSHTYDNVKCACRSCNNRKGNRNHGQQILPGLGYLYA